MWGVYYGRAALIVLIAALALLQAAQASPASADIHEHRVIVGLATSSANVYPWWWHGENDLDLTSRNGPTPGLYVYNMSTHWSGFGDTWMKAVAVNYSMGSECTGRYVYLYDPADNYLGRLNYVHIAPSIPDGETWIIPGSGWNIVLLGSVLDWGEEDPDCEWTAPHLHQGGVGEGDGIQHNVGLEALVASEGHTNYIEPTAAPANHWMHRVSWTDPDPIDSDGDGCSDQEELDMGFNPLAWYDVFDVPKPAVADPTPNGIRNGVVDIGDVLAVLFYTFADDNGPPNASGVDYDSVKGSCLVQGVISEEGLCYDRTAGDPPTPQGFDPSGPPNGVIDMADVITALTQANQVDCSQPP